MKNERKRCWDEFRRAVESALAGDFGPAKALVSAHPIVQTELRRFYQARKAGRIIKTEQGYRNVKAGK